MSKVASALRWVALIGTLGSIATLEYLAGQAAGWGDLRSVGVPIGIDAFVMGVLIAPRARAFDRAAALLLMEFTVVVSAVAGHHDKLPNGQDANVPLGAVLATALVFALWRVDETIRADKGHAEADALEQAHARTAEVERSLRDTQRELARALAVQQAAASSVAAGEPQPEGPKLASRHAAPPVRTATVPDDELAAIIRRILTDKPEAGYGKVVAAIEGAGWLVGNTGRVKTAIATHKQRRGLTVLDGAHGRAGAL